MAFTRNIPNARVGLYYAAGAAVAGLAGTLVPPWSWIALWPALALAGVAVGYFGLGPSIYGKRDGRLPLGRRLLFAPTLLGQHASLCHYRRQCRPWDEAVPGFLIGRTLTAREAAPLAARGPLAVLDLTAEFSETEVLRRSAVYHNLPILDLSPPTQVQLRNAVAFISEQLAGGHTVYVHCKVGYSRTAAVAGAYLLSSGRCPTAEAAMAHLRRARPPIVIRPEAEAALHDFAATPVSDISAGGRAKAERAASQD